MPQQLSDFYIPYLDQCLKDYGMERASVEEQEQVLEMVFERLQDVTVQTALILMNEDQRLRFKAAIGKQPADEDDITRIGAEIPGFSQALEEALSQEYELLASAMKR